MWIDFGGMVCGTRGCNASFKKYSIVDTERSTWTVDPVQRYPVGEWVVGRNSHDKMASHNCFCFVTSALCYKNQIACFVLKALFMKIFYHQES